MANIVEKWMFCYQKFNDAQTGEGVEPIKVDAKCVCFERENVEPDPKMGIEGGTVSLLLFLRSKPSKEKILDSKMNQFWISKLVNGNRNLFKNRLWKIEFSSEMFNLTKSIELVWQI